MNEKLNDGDGESNYSRKLTLKLFRLKIHLKMFSVIKVVTLLRLLIFAMVVSLEVHIDASNAKKPFTFYLAVLYQSVMRRAIAKKDCATHVLTQT